MVRVALTLVVMGGRGAGSAVLARVDETVQLTLTGRAIVGDVTVAGAIEVVAVTAAVAVVDAGLDGIAALGGAFETGGAFAAGGACEICWAIALSCPVVARTIVAGGRALHQGVTEGEGGEARETGIAAGRGEARIAGAISRGVVTVSVG